MIRHQGGLRVPDGFGFNFDVSYFCRYISVSVTSAPSSFWF